MQEVQSILAKITAELDARERELNDREEAIRKREQAVRDLIAKKDKVSIDVGGQVFSFSRETLTKHENSVFGVLLMEEGIPFVDRDPYLFRHVACYLRHGIRRTCEPYEMSLVEKEFEFWCLDTREEALTLFETPNGTLTNGGRTLRTVLSSGIWSCFTHSSVPLSNGMQFTLSSSTPEKKFMIGLCTLPIVFTQMTPGSNKLHRSMDISAVCVLTLTYTRGVGLHNSSGVWVSDLSDTTEPVYLYIGLCPGCEITISQ